jgi:DNA-binding cell septation regulator SpoVG
MADINKEMAANLWEKLDVTLSRFTAHLDIREKSTLLGFVSVKVDVPSIPGLVLYAGNIAVKLLKGNPYLAFPQEQGKDEKWYDIYCPGSAELRAVITTAVFQDEQVQAAILAAAEQQRPAAERTGSTGTSNPFSA